MNRIPAVLRAAVLGLLLLSGCSANPVADQLSTGSLSHADGSGAGGGGGGGY